MSTLAEKTARLRGLLAEMGSAAVAYSGGVDSTLVLKLAHGVLGDRVIAVTAVSESLPGRELLQAEAIAREIGARHVLLETRETEDDRYRANTSARCFFCKGEVYGELAEYARREGFRYVLDGTNIDDTGDHRPGLEAAKRHGVRSPLEEAGLTKAEVRETALALGLPNWDKPAAACLASRVPYGVAITMDMLSQVERAEAALHELGFGQLRVRHHDDVARIEIEPEEFERALVRREEIVEAVREAGYTYVCLDLAGFRSGSLNETWTRRSSNGS